MIWQQIASAALTDVNCCPQKDVLFSVSVYWCV